MGDSGILSLVMKNLAVNGDEKAFQKREDQCKAEIVLRDGDSQLLHMAGRSPMIVWNSLASVHHVRGFGS